MNKFLFLLIFLSLSYNSNGQKYRVKYVQEKADSILKSYIGDSLFVYCHRSSKSVYEYRDFFLNSTWETFGLRKKTQGKFVEAEMKWDVQIPYSKCPAYDTIKGTIGFNLDRLLYPRTKPVLDFLPDFYLKNDSCHFISESEVLNIAKSQELKPGVGPLTARIEYDKDSKTFNWYVTNVLSKDEGEFETRSEILVIDPKTSKVKRHLFTISQY